ncbi:hypothetical protein N2152v2_010163 [Parachlorella kessleri]
MEAAGETPAGRQHENQAPQRAQQQTSSMARGLDPKQVFEQPDLQAVLSLLRSVPPQQLGGSAMGVALLCVDKWQARQRKRSAVAASPAEEAAAQAIVQLGWQQLASLPAGALVSLLLATLCVTVPTKTLVVAWVSAMQACNGVRELYPCDRAGLLEAAHKLATQSGGELYVPSGMLTNNLLRLVTGDRASRLPLPQLASVWVAIHGLGLWLTSEQQLVLASAVVQHLGPDKPVNGVALTQILTTWVDMEPVHIAWKSEQGPNGIPRLDRQQDFPQGEAQPRGSTPHADHHQQQERQLPPAMWQAPGGGTQEPPQRAWQRQLPAQERWGQAQQQQQHDGYAETRVALGRQSYPESLEADEMEDGVASYDGTTCRPPSGYPGHKVMCAVVLHCHAHREQLGSWALGQLLGALGALRHAPPPAILTDLVEAFWSKLLGPEQARELTSALTGLARLGLDPGEAVCKACFQVAMAYGGADQLFLATVAWALTMFRRCTPGQWAMLLALHGAPSPPSASVGASGGESVAHGHFPTRWLTAYHLLLEQYGSQLPLPMEGTAGPGVGAADRPAAGWAPATVEGVGAADSGMAGARAGQSVARLPDGLFEQGVLLQQQVLERDRPVRRTMYHATLTVGMAGARAGQSVARLPDGLFEQGVLLQQQVLERDRPVRRTMYHATLTVGDACR